jgi:hypothetical protein
MKEEKTVEASPVNIDAELAAIQSTVMDLTYDGFNAVEIRANLHQQLTSQEIVTLVSAYCQIGNNVNRAVGKVKKPRNDIVGLLKKSGTTLARAGLAFGALVKALRVAYPKNFGPRVPDCKTPVIFQDPAIAPYHAEGRDFHDKFSRLITRPRTSFGTDYFTLARLNLDPTTDHLMSCNLEEVVAAIKKGAY